MTKTFFTSDSHFQHPNIMKYETQRITETVKYIFSKTSQFEFLKKISDINSKYNNPVLYSSFYGTNNPKTFIENIIKNIFDYNNFYDENMTKEQIESFKLLQQEQMKVVLDYETEMIIERWNNVVGKDDIVYFLGDFAFRNKTEAEKIGRRLNGHKTIILGNHDDRKHNPDGSVKYNSILEAHFKASGFERVEFNPIILKRYFILSHEPLYYMNDNIPYFNIYGHVHSDKRYQTKTSNSFCCCLDRHDYKPVELEEYNTYKIN